MAAWSSTPHCTSCSRTDHPAGGEPTGQTGTPAPLEVVGLTGLMDSTAGAASVRVALIDGSVLADHPDLAPVRLIPVGDPGSATCTTADSFACRHGTFVAGVLSARRGSPAPGICPGCTLLVRPVFLDAAPNGAGMPTATPMELAHAIVEVVDAGARLVNISSALFSPSLEERRAIEEALTYASRRGVLVIAAAGNQGELSSSVITRHPSVIPVAAYGSHGRPLPLSNLGRHLGQRGVGAPGAGITSLGKPGTPETGAGTSVAAPFVTGTLALLASRFPTATASHLRRALRPSLGDRRTTVVPPLLDAKAAYEYLSGIFEQRSETRMMRRSSFAGSSESGAQRGRSGVVAAAQVVPSQDAAPPNGGGSPNGGAEGSVGFVFAIGRVETSFPNLSVEREFAQATGREDVSGLTDGQAMVSTLTSPGNRYLARQLCWVLSIEGLPTYILQPSDPRDFDILIEALRENPTADDMDVVVGARGPVAPPEMCNGLELPIVAFEQLYSFARDELVSAIPRPEDVDDERFTNTANELLTQVMQIADNAGSADEHRALNYLAVRYPSIYATASDMHNRNLSLTAIEARPSRLALTERIVDVIFTFTHRETDVPERFFVRVNVSSMFPFLVSKMAPYFDR